jgi:hypothetical protein
MNEIIDTALTLWRTGRKTKQTASGWISGNAVCCHHRGENVDTKGRGGILISDEGFSWHCFNCGFKAGWVPGKLLSSNTKMLFKWLGLNEIELGRLGLTALRLQEGQISTKKSLNFDLKQVNLPDNCFSIDHWIRSGNEDLEFVQAIEYILNRGMKLEWYPWHWSSTNGYRDRVIVPFYHEGKIVGYTGRKIVPGKPKYLTDSQSGYVFNLDRQNYHRQYIIVTEGQFDAVAIDGVAIMTNEPNEVQMSRINAQGKEVIVVPDRDRPGAKMIQAALKNKWSVSVPPWENDVKDVADAVKKYGRLYTLYTILHYKETNELKIQLLKKKLEKLTDE